MNPVDDLLNRSLEELQISVRARNALRSCLGVRTIGELCQYTSDDVLECRCIGITQLGSIKDGLATVGLCLRGESPARDFVEPRRLGVEVLGLPEIHLTRLRTKLGLTTLDRLVQMPVERLEACLRARGMAELMQSLARNRGVLPVMITRWFSDHARSQLRTLIGNPASHVGMWIGVLDTCWKTRDWLWDRGVATVCELLTHSDVDLWLMAGSSHEHLDEVKVRLSVFRLRLADYIPDPEVARRVEREPEAHLDAPVSILGVRRRTLQVLEGHGVRNVREAVVLVESVSFDSLFERFPIGRIDVRQQLMALGFLRRHRARSVRLGSPGGRILVGAS